MEIAHEGGIFITRRLGDASEEGRALLQANGQLQEGLGLGCGVSHSEFIRRGDGDYVFLESSSRVGGAFIADAIEAATGINLWREWARIEIAGKHGEYAVPAQR